MTSGRRISSFYLVMWFAAVLLLAGANGHLLYVAFATHPPCIAAEPGLQPARRAC